MESPRIYDNHTFFLKCECASIDQIRDAFIQAVTTYQNANKINLNCGIRVNLVKNNNGESYGIAFVFVTNPAVYHMLLGKNPDGSDRIEYRDDPCWTPPVNGDIVNDAGWSTISAPVYTPGMNWADLIDEEEEYDRRIYHNIEIHTCPKIPIPLEPLMVLPPYHLTPEQIEARRLKIIANNEGKQDFTPDLVKIPQFVHFNIDRAMATPVDSKFMPNILKCAYVPNWISKIDIKLQFRPYASDSETLQQRVVGGNIIEETYPFVNINKEQVAFIIFDPSTHDAQFALHMMKKFTFNVKTENGQINSTTLIFTHSYRTDRDMMSLINQKQIIAGKRDNSRQRYMYTTDKKPRTPDRQHNLTVRHGIKNSHNVNTKTFDNENSSFVKKFAKIPQNNNDFTKPNANNSTKNRDSHRITKSTNGNLPREFIVNRNNNNKNTTYEQRRNDESRNFYDTQKQNTTITKNVTKSPKILQENSRKNFVAKQNVTSVETMNNKRGNTVKITSKKNNINYKSLNHQNKRSSIIHSKNIFDILNSEDE